MNRIYFFIELYFILLLSTVLAIGQTTTPAYDNIKVEKAMNPLHKIKHALIFNTPVRQPQFNRSINNWSYNNRISLFKKVTHFEPTGDLHKVKLDYMPKPNIGLLYNKFQY